jgi:hypothetical protein
MAGEENMKAIYVLLILLVSTSNATNYDWMIGHNVTFIGDPQSRNFETLVGYASFIPFEFGSVISTKDDFIGINFKNQTHWINIRYVWEVFM